MNTAVFCGTVRMWNAFCKKLWMRPQMWQKYTSIALSNMSTFRTAILLLLFAYLWKTLPGVFDRPSAVPHGGFVHPDFQEVKDVFEKRVETGAEPGASFAVYHKGKALVDLWGGYADPEALRPWEQNTLSQAWSCTKGVVAVVVAMLVDRGFLDYSEHVHKYWPEFQQNGKSNITLGMLLSHQAGLVSLDRQISLLEYRDNWTAVEQLMAQAKPAWPPGTMYSYHAYTYGMYADAIVRKVDPKHRNISQFFKEEIAGHFGLDFHIGLPTELYFRATRARYVQMWQILRTVFLEKPSRWKWASELLPEGVVSGSLNVVDISNNMNVMNDPELQSIGLPSAIGFGTARSLAMLYDYLANRGSIKGKRLLSERLVAALSTPVTLNIPVILAPDQPYAMGTGVETNIEGGVIFGHRGYGGQTAFADPNYEVGVSYITNFNGRYSESDDPRVHDLLNVLYKCLEKYRKQQR